MTGYAVALALPPYDLSQTQVASCRACLYVCSRKSVCGVAYIGAAAAVILPFIDISVPTAAHRNASPVTDFLPVDQLTLSDPG